MLYAIVYLPTGEFIRYVNGNGCEPIKTFESKSLATLFIKRHTPPILSRFLDKSPFYSTDEDFYSYGVNRQIPKYLLEVVEV